MTVGEVLKLVKIRLHNIAIAKDDKSLILLLNLGVSELYRRFDMKVGTETILINDNLAFYQLRNPDVTMLLSLYDKKGRELRQTDVLDGYEYDYKLVNYRTFMLRKPFNGILYALYKASAVPLADMDDVIDLPDGMIEALLAYISYAGYNTINRDNMNESQLYFQRFEAACANLDMQGYKMSLSTERPSITTKGYV